MKKLLLTLIAFFVISVSAFALDIKDVSKKVEAFYKSGTYVKSIDTVSGATYYCFKQNIGGIYIYADGIRIDTVGNVDKTSLLFYDGEIKNIYIQDGNLIIEWKSRSYNWD